MIYKDRTGDALKAALRAFEYGGRQTGRTTRMIKMLRPGDRVVCANGIEAQRLVNELKTQRIEGIQVVVGAPHQGEPLGHDCRFLAERMPTHFTHEWYEAYYAHELDALTKRLSEIEFIVQGPRREAEHAFLVAGG